jgi:hypothetical protein
VNHGVQGSPEALAIGHARIGYRLQTLFWDGSFTLEQP